MECVIANEYRHGDLSVFADALARLAEIRVETGGIACIGLRFLDFSATAWQEAWEWLMSSDNACVSSPERAQANRYLHREDGVRHLAARSLLRNALIGHGVEMLPDAWPVNAWGKPEGGTSGMHFNISHSGSDVWVALCREVAVGIDVEEDSPTSADLSPWLHPAEIEDLSAYSDAQCRRRLWARKEAVIKAAGAGLSLPLADFRVALDDRTAGWLIDAPRAYPLPWTTYDIPLRGSPAVAVAARGQCLTLSWRLEQMQCG